jgi:dTMP kinase
VTSVGSGGGADTDLRAPRLVVFEGIDGSGKTVQACAAVDYLMGLGRSVHLTREPSDGPIGRLIREFLIGRHALPDRASDPRTLALLFAADRADHCEREVLPRIRSGQIVVSDRWYHTSLAYQGSGGVPSLLSVGRPWVWQCNQGAARPDLTIFLRVAPEIAAVRRRLAGRTTELFDDPEIQQRCAAGYEAAITFAWSLGERVEILDGHASTEDVGRQVQVLLDDLLGISRVPNASWDSSRDPQR